VACMPVTLPDDLASAFPRDHDGQGTCHASTGLERGVTSCTPGPGCAGPRKTVKHGVVVPDPRHGHPAGKMASRPSAGGLAFPTGRHSRAVTDDERPHRDAARSPQQLTAYRQGADCPVRDQAPIQADEMLARLNASLGAQAPAVGQPAAGTRR